MAKDKRSYGELLLDTMWQRKKNEIQRRDNFTCQICRSTTKTLHVHHQFYRSGKAPWEYEDEHLILLCVDCHEVATVDMNRLRESLCSLGPQYFSRVRGYVDAIVSAKDGHTILRFEPGDIGYQLGVADYAGITVDDLRKLNETQQVTHALIVDHLRTEEIVWGINADEAADEAIEEACEDLLS